MDPGNVNDQRYKVTQRMITGEHKTFSFHLMREHSVQSTMDSLLFKTSFRFGVWTRWSLKLPYTVCSVLMERSATGLCGENNFFDYFLW